MLIFDIETGPLPLDELMALCPPFDESPFQPSEFDPASVKIGNLKDPGKIADKIAEARQWHEAEQARLPATLEAARAAHAAEFVGRAALSPRTGRVEAIGLMSSLGVFGVISGDECDILSAFWAKVEKCASQNRKLIGHNIFGFDLPFLVFRSWLLEVDVPMELILPQDRYYNSQIFTDTMTRWGRGSRSIPYIGLEEVAFSFGYPGKPEGVTGADFSRLWRGTPEDRAKAEAYLLNDLQMTASIARRMQIF